MVSVENQTLPVLVIVAIQILLMTPHDVAIGTHLGKMEGSLGRGTRDGGSQVKYRTQFPNGEGAQDRNASQDSSGVTLHGGPEGPDHEHWLQRACCPHTASLGGRMALRPQQASPPLCELFWGCFSCLQSAPPQLTRTHIPSRQMVGRVGATPALPCYPIPPSRQCWVQESSCPYPVTEMEGSQKQEGPRCGSVQPPVGLFQTFRF